MNNGESVRFELGTEVGSTALTDLSLAAVRWLSKAEVNATSLFRALRKNNIPVIGVEVRHCRVPTGSSVGT